MHEGVDLANRLAVRQRKRFSLCQIHARRRLIAVTSGEPDVVRVERGKERFDLMFRAAGVGAGPPQSRCRFGGAQVHQAQIPRLREHVAVRVGLLEMVDGIEKQHRNIWALLPQHVEEDDTLRLEAAGHAG
jgi:hypothetical protein